MEQNPEMFKNENPIQEVEIHQTPQNLNNYSDMDKYAKNTLDSLEKENNMPNNNKINFDENAKLDGYKDENMVLKEELNSHNKIISKDQTEKKFEGQMKEIKEDTSSGDKAQNKNGFI